MTSTSSLGRKPKLWIQFLMLMAMFWRELDTLPLTSATYDEYIYLARGYTYLKTGDARLKTRHPILVDGLASLPLLTEPDVRLPLDDDGWLTGDFHTYSHAFLWEANAAKADKLVWLARIPVIWLSLLLATAVARWAHELFGFEASLLSLFIYTFDPAILAHGRLVTPDIGQTALMFLSALMWWRYLVRPGWGRLVLCGVTFGLAQAAGFPAMIAYLIFPLAILVREQGTGPGWIRRVWRQGWRFALVSGLSLASVWAVYGFTWGPVDALGISLPAPYHWTELLDLLDRMQRRDLAYCCGEVYRGGRLVFFPLALAIKTPVTTLVLLCLGIWTLVRLPGQAKRVAVLWLMPLLYFGNAVRSSLNIGYRHILPVLPYLFVIAGGAIQTLWHWRLRRWLLVGLCVWLGIASALIHPFYLAYFNETIGGPEQAYRYLAVSDLDWGQDLPGLRDYVAENKVDTLLLSWFGTTPPEHYGIDYQRLPGWPPPEHPERVAWHPDYPLPGTYAISVANLVAARLPGQDPYAAFRAREPQERIGYSVYVYEVPKLLNTDSPPVDLTLSGFAYSDLPSDVITSRFQTNDVRLRWTEADRAMVLTDDDSYFVSDAMTAAGSPVIQHLLSAEALAHVTTRQDANGHQFELYRGDLGAAHRATVTIADVAAAPSLVPESGAVILKDLPVQFGDQLSLLGYHWLVDAEVGAPLRLLSVWRVTTPTQLPLAIFVHLLSEDGTILSQDDRLDVVLSACESGDVIIQLHNLETNPAGELAPTVQLGVYRRDTLQRLPIVELDATEVMSERVILQTP